MVSSMEKEEESEEIRRARERAKEHTIAGGVLGAASLGSLAVFGTFACPLCVVAAPALICSGIWNARKARKGCGAEEMDRFQNEVEDYPERIEFPGGKRPAGTG